MSRRKIDLQSDSQRNGRRDAWSVSVRDFVEFIVRYGDIDERKGSRSDLDAMLLGSRIHRKIQKQMGRSYRAEVKLRHCFDMGEYDLLLEGRCDGIIDDDPPAIDEIKGVFYDVQSMEGPEPVHLAQAKSYAYMYALLYGEERMGVQMTYAHLETEEVRRFRYEYAFTELETWFLGLLDDYRIWMDFYFAWKKERNASASAVAFPYEYREGQKQVAAAVYHTVRERKKLFLQAPTGVGKTVMTIFPSVKAVGEGLAEKIFYLTAKTTTRSVAQETFELFREHGLRFKTVTLTAKEKICPMEEPLCNPDDCPYAKGHFDRINDAVYDILTGENGCTRETVLAYSEKHTVCPFELGLDLSLWTDAIICDYNYVFDPNAHLRRYFSDEKKNPYIFLIDEAHNLVDRGRNMYSAALIKEDFSELRKAVLEKNPALAKTLARANRLMGAWRRSCESRIYIDSLGSFPLTLMNVMTQLQQFMEEGNPGEASEACLDLFFKIRHFLAMEDLLDEHYRIYASYTERGRFMVRLFCIDPSQNLRSYFNKGAAAVLFSATLLPISYYKKLLGADEDDYAVYARSPFDRKKLLVMRGKGVTSRYTLRTEDMYRQIARYIEAAVSCKTGNYIAFFPSYRLLEDVFASFEEICSGQIRTICQTQDMDEEKRLSFLEAFEGAERDETLVGFCVMGGIFSEGIDLDRDKLIGAVIVGTGLPGVSDEQEILMDYFRDNGLPGFDYAYLFIGMNRVLQAAGRVIRTEEDKGFVLLLDDRFTNTSYLNLYPREWENVSTFGLDGVKERLAAFWNEKES